MHQLEGGNKETKYVSLSYLIAVIFCILYIIN